MNIEISDEKYWKELNYYDALLYCQLLDIDGKNNWRLIESVEELYGTDDIFSRIDNDLLDKIDNDLLDKIWFSTDDNRYELLLTHGNYMVIPVRDL